MAHRCALWFRLCSVGQGLRFPGALCCVPSERRCEGVLDTVMSWSCALVYWHRLPRYSDRSGRVQGGDSWDKFSQLCCDPCCPVAGPAVGLQ